MTGQNLKSGTGDEIHVSLLSGHAITIGAKPRFVPQMFVREALINGAIPASMSADDVAPGSQPENEQKDRATLIKDACKRLLEAGSELTGAGMLPVREVSAEVGFTVTKEELTEVWQVLEAEAASE